MPIAHLTQEATIGKQPTPITINPDHVTKLEPRYRPIPNQGSQLGGLVPQYQGSIVHLVTGDQVRVLEDYEVADSRLWPSHTPTGLAGGTIGQSQITGLSEALAKLPDLPVTEGTPEAKAIDASAEPAKKAPGKKAAPKAEAKEDTSEEKDED